MTDSKENTELRSNYHFGSLYVTYIPLNDLTQLLNDPGKLPKLREETSQPGCLDTFRSFLKMHASERLNAGIAFLQLELTILKAGYKKISDRDGVIHPTSWSGPDVQGIAELCDRYFRRLSTFEVMHESIRSGDVSVGQAFKTFSEFKDDPFLTNSNKASLLANVKGLIDEKPHELVDLKRSDAATYKSIKTLSDEYNAYLLKQRSEQPLARLWANERVFVKTSEELDKAKQKLDTMLSEKGVISSLRDSTASLERFGLRFENSDPVDMFKANLFLANNELVKGRLALGESFTDILSTESDVFGGSFGGGGGVGGVGGGGGGPL